MFENKLEELKKRIFNLRDAYHSVKVENKGLRKENEHLKNKLRIFSSVNDSEDQEIKLLIEQYKSENKELKFTQLQTKRELKRLLNRLDELIKPLETKL